MNADKQSAIGNPKSAMPSPVGIAVVFVHGTGLLSRAIESVTRSPYSHALIRFDLDDGSAEYFESLFARGVIGPRAIMNLWDYQAEHPGVFHTAIQLNCNARMAAGKYAIAQTFVGSAGYGEMQLIAMWLFKRFGWRVPLSIGRVVCSEFVARVIFPEWDVTDAEHTFDEIDPGFLYGRLRKLTTEVTENTEKNKT